MFGFLLSLKQLVSKISPTGRGGFYACNTSAYKLHYFETASGLRFVLTTDLTAGDLRDTLRHIYSQIFVETLSKNPLYTPGEPITCAQFTQTLERYIGALTTARAGGTEERARFDSRFDRRRFRKSCSALADLRLGHADPGARLLLPSEKHAL